MTEQNQSILPVLYLAGEEASMLMTNRSIADRPIQQGDITTVRINQSAQISDLERSN